MTKYRFTSAALFELKEGVLYYEQKENGLGIIFLDEIDATVERILRFPHSWHPMSARTKSLPHAPFSIRSALSITIKRDSDYSRDGLAARSEAVARINLDMEENGLSRISKADSDEKIGEFWDSHDFIEFDTTAPDAEFDVISTVPTSGLLSFVR